jgi:hypothetical protein
MKCACADLSTCAPRHESRRRRSTALQLVFEGCCRADAAWRWRDDLRVVRFLGIVMWPRWRAGRKSAATEHRPPVGFRGGAAAPMAWGVGGTTSVSSVFLGIVIGPRWRAGEVGGDGAPPSSLGFEVRCRADGAGRWRDDLRVVRFLGIVMWPRWRAEGVGGDGAPPSSWFLRGRFRALGSEWPELRGSRVKK